MIFQLQDDHSRLAVATRSHGVPQRLLTDNGLALNPSRRGWEGQLVAYATSLGV